MSVSINSSPSSLGLAELLSSHEVVGGWHSIVLVSLWCGILHGLTGVWGGLLANLVGLGAVLGSGLEAIPEILEEAEVHQLEGWNWRNRDIGTSSGSAGMLFAVNVTKVDGGTLGAIDWSVHILVSIAVADICGYFNETHTFFFSDFNNYNDKIS